MNSKKKKRDRDRPALVEIDNLREKTGERERERNKKLSDGDTWYLDIRENVCFFLFLIIKEKTEIYKKSVCVCVCNSMSNKDHWHGDYLL